MEYQLKFSFTDISTHITGRIKDNVLESLLTSIVSVCNDRGAMSDCVPTKSKIHEVVFLKSSVSLSKFLRVYEANYVREAIGSSTGIMDCSQDLGATLEEDGELTITPVCDIKSN